MKTIKNVWFDQKQVGNYGVVDIDGKLYRFNLTPFREITDTDLTPLPDTYRIMLQDWMEMKQCEYKFYKLEKEQRRQEKWEEKNDIIAKTYKIRRDIAEDFADACKKSDISLKNQLEKMMLEFIEEVRSNE